MAALKPKQFIKILKRASKLDPKQFIEKAWEYVEDLNISENKADWFENYLDSMENALNRHEFQPVFITSFIGDVEAFFSISTSKDARKEMYRGKTNLYPKVTLELFEYVTTTLQSPNLFDKGEWYEYYDFPIILSGGFFDPKSPAWGALPCKVYNWEGLPVIDKQTVMVSSIRRFGKFGDKDKTFWEALREEVKDSNLRSLFATDKDPAYIVKGNLVCIWLVNKRFSKTWQKHEDSAFSNWETFDIPGSANS